MEDIRPRPSRAAGGTGRVLKGGAAAAKTAYDDVFGGPPRYAAVRDLEDHYVEIFGGFAASCNIPFLELPKAIDAGFDSRVNVKGSGFDYSEIFGGIDAGEFGVSYEELFGEETEEEFGEATGELDDVQDLDARKDRQQSAGEEVVEENNDALDASDGHFSACSENSKLLSDLHSPNDGSKQFNVSYHMASRGIIEDACNGTTHVTQLNAVPGFTVVVNACSPSENVEYENPPNMATCDVSTNANMDGRMKDKNQEKMSPCSSFVTSTNSTVHDHKADKQSTTMCPDSEDVPADMKQHSRSSSFHSMSSGDLSYSDVSFVTVSDISLRTQPLQVPPPTRPPPKVRNKHGHPRVKMATNLKVVLNDGRCEVQEAVKGSSPSFYDVEMDARSAAAASAAAMKEAMEQAQARLKSAKELMERKRESLQSRKKLANHEGIQCEARKVEEDPQDGKIFSEEITEKSLVKEDKMMNSFVVVGREKSIEADEVVAHHQKEDSYAAQGAQHTPQGKQSKSSQVPGNLGKPMREDEVVSVHRKEESHAFQGAQHMPQGKESKSSQLLDNLGKPIRDDEVVSDHQKKESHAPRGAQQKLQGKESKSSQVPVNWGKTIKADGVVSDCQNKESHVAQGPRMTLQGKEFKSSQVPDNLGKPIMEDVVVSDCQKKESNAAPGAQPAQQGVGSKSSQVLENFGKSIRLDDVVTGHESKENHATQGARWAPQGTESKSSGEPIRVDRVVAGHQKKESRETQGARQMPHGNESNSSEALDKLETTGEWKTENEFVELLHSDMIFKIAKDVSEQESMEKKSKEGTAAVGGESERKDAETTPAFKKMRKLWKDSRSCEQDGHAKKVSAGNTAIREELITGHQKEDRRAAQGAREAPKKKESNSSEVLDKLEKAGEWKTGNEFYELIHSDTKLKIVKDVSEHESIDKNFKERTAAVEDGENESEVHLATHEFKKTRKQWKASETCEQEANVKKVNAGNTASKKEEIKDILIAIRETFMQEEHVNKPQEDDHATLLEENSKKLKEIQMDCSAKVDDEEAVSACKQSEKILEPSNGRYNHGKVHLHDEHHRKTEPVKVVPGFKDDEEELNVSCESEGTLKLSNETSMKTTDGIKTVPYGSCALEAGQGLNQAQRDSQCDNVEEPREASTVESSDAQNEIKMDYASKVLQQEDCHGLYKQEVYNLETDENLQESQEAHKLEENVERVKETEEIIGYAENGKGIEAEKAACADGKMDKMPEKCQLDVQQNDKNQKADQEPCKPECHKKWTAAEREHGQIAEILAVADLGEDQNRSTLAQEGLQMQNSLNGWAETVQQNALLEKKGISVGSSKYTKGSQCTTTKRTIPDVRIAEEREKMERERVQQAEWARRLEEEREREREREKDRKAVEGATREAHERARSEARERAERIAVERVTAEARQRAFLEARDKAEKASAEALEKSLAEKASREARVRAERAAVERATAEARERAVERARAEKAALDARERSEKFSATYRDRLNKDNEAGDSYWANNMEDAGTKANPIGNNVPASEFQNAAPNSQRLSASNGNFEGPESDSPLRCKARLERHQRTVERARKALAEKNMRDMLAQREQAERNRMADSLDAEVRRWSNAKEGNLRALLSTLQYILGPESGWQPIPLTDVITAAAVKKAYRKATLCVHPDKLQQRGANIQQKYICEKVFDLLKDAWNRFNSEER